MSTTTASPMRAASGVPRAGASGRRDRRAAARPLARVARAAVRGSAGCTSTNRTFPTRRRNRSPRDFAEDPYRAEVAAADAALAPAAGADPRRRPGRPHAGRADGGSRRVARRSRRGDARGLRLRSDAAECRSSSIDRACSRRRRRRPAQHVDILPTILDALGAAVPSGLRARACCRDRRRQRTDGASRATYFEALSATLNRRWAPLHGVIQNGVKYVELPVPELYDLRRIHVRSGTWPRRSPRVPRVALLVSSGIFVLPRPAT